MDEEIGGNFGEFDGAIRTPTPRPEFTHMFSGLRP
jgi:hypothetical protein